MASNSDHDKNRTNLIDLLPEVYRSDVNETMLEASFNKFLTKDDTTHVAGYIGQGNPNALVNRQLQEPSPHRQAFQLAPVMYSRVGTEEYVLTFKGFQQQLQLMGVDIPNLDQWATTQRFNWIPPVNIDMLINYADYYWKPEIGQTPPQHFTIENRCNKVTSKLNAYKGILARRGETMDITRIDFQQNAFVINSKQDDVFVEGFVFKTKGTTNVNLEDKTWTTLSSVYNGDADETVIYITPNLALVVEVEDVNNQPAYPPAAYTGQWLYKYSTNPATPLSQLFTWNGAAWVITGQSFPCHISLVDQQAVYQAEVNCTCESDTGGWDTKQWDDGQQTDAIWNTELLANISFDTEAEWITNNGDQPVAGDTWYDLTADQLKQRNQTNTAWIVVQQNFSEVLIETTGTARWDASIGCLPQEHNQWTTQNKWVHKSELTTFVGAYRAQVPILEYSSQTEMNEWTEVTYTWKYRRENDKTFDTVSTPPTRLELEPIKSYIANNIDGVWFIYLGSEFNSANRDIDYTSVFTAGYKFRIVDKYGLSEIFTTTRSWYREIGPTDPQYLTQGQFVTIVQIEETDFPAPVEAGVFEYETNPPDPDAPRYTRIEPIRTSIGDSWKGYHVHWMLDVKNITQKAAAPQQLNPYYKIGNQQATESISLTEGSVTVASTYQEFIPIINNITQVNLDYRFHFKPQHPGYYAIAGENQLRVYLNGVRQYGTYTELTTPSTITPDYTVVDNVNIPIGQVNAKVSYVYAIQFFKPLTINDVVRIEVAPIAYKDMGLYGIPVRTIEDNNEFKSAVLVGAQPVYKPLTKYQRTEQVKSKINQYPLFNMYDVVTGELVGTSPIFGFVESPDEPVNSSTQRRIVASTDGKEYQFEQFLVDENNGVMYAYRNITGNEPAHWYSPLTQKLKKWDGKTWAESIVSVTLTGMAAYEPVVSATEPTELRGQHMSVWVNPTTLGFYQRDAINNVWNVIEDVAVNNADPTLQTIWQTSATTPEYVPDWVDAKQNAAPYTYTDGTTPTEFAKGDSRGDWEVISQWKNNPEHENHRTILYSQLITHLSSIVSQQERIPGLTNGGIFTLNQKDYDYGVGGTIKEHNDAFDTLISAVNVTEMTPVGVIEFAQEQYAANMVTMRDLFNGNIVDALIELSGYSVEQLKPRINERCIREFVTNDYVAKVYGDTTAYDATTGVGMPNWIATLPIIGLARATRPHIVSDGTSIIIRHHDGHSSVVSYSLAEQDRIYRVMIKKYNSASPGSAVISATEPVGSILPVYWYHIGGGNHTLYKLKTQQPTSWERVDLVDLLGSLFLDIETKLYQATPSYPLLKFDFSTLTSTVDLKQVFDGRMKQRFNEYVVKKNIRTPFVNTTYNATDAFTWNYAQCMVDTPPRAGITHEPRSCWQAVYELWYGTAYPHLEPWKLQGYGEKPVWWDGYYADITGTRRWVYNHAAKIGMWENIRTGVVPAGCAYPNGIVSTGNPTADNVSLPTYNYFSVNISDSEITGGYQPDTLLPPYYDNTNVAPIHPTVRSLYRVFSTQVVAPNADYLFGEYGPAEWEWSISGEHVYDEAVVAFLMQPAKFLYQTFGLDYVTIGGLQVDVIGKKVYSHKNALFHGDIYDKNKVYETNGLNQWYVNFNRFKGFDTNVGFREMWTNWSPKQSYQTAGIIDTNTLQIFNKNFDVTEKDYSVILANSGVISEKWVDGFELTILSIPPAIIQYNNQSKWKIVVDALAPVSRTIEYYGPQIWPFMIDRDTDVLTAFQFDIDDVTASINTFEIRHDQTPFFLEGVAITVSNSSTNDGVYTVVNAVFDAVNDMTRVKVAENVATSIRDGVIDIPDYAHNWNTGDVVVMSATSALPYPIADKTPYYVIVVDDRRIKLATTASNAQVNIAVDITSDPIGDITIGKIKSSFQVFGGNSASTDLWIHYEPNLADVRTATLPETIVGMQTLVNMIDGYTQLQNDKNVVYNNSNDFVEYDTDTGRPVSWQVEMERFIDWAYGLRRSRLQLNDRYEFTVNDMTANTLRFTTAAPSWTSGTKLAVTTTGTLPQPLFGNTVYYLVTTSDPQVFQLSVSTRVDETTIVDLSTMGSGIMHIALFTREQTFPSFELNPIRNNVWIRTPQGMLSNIITGPYADIRVSQKLYDQYGRALTADKITVYREDKMSRISVRAGIPNDVELYPFGFVDPYNYLHIGGGHFFVEGYEHIIMFNDYTVGDDLVYDPFLGLYIKRFDLDYFEKTDYTLRPTLGGYYLSDGAFKRNFEGSIEDMRQYYDAFELTEGTQEARYARHLLGYNPDQTVEAFSNDSVMSYLDLLNVNSKSQFLFYRGMIQSKGSINSVKAYINSKKFVDAKVDEFWAYKIAEFGESRSKIYPQIKLFGDDGTKTDVRLKFTTPTDIDKSIIDDVRRGFDTVSFRDNNRWVDFPQQREEIQSPLFLDASISTMTRLYVTHSTTDGTTPTETYYPKNGENTLDYWIHVNHSSTPVIYTRQYIDGGWIDVVGPDVSMVGMTGYMKLPKRCEGVRILRQRLNQPGNLIDYRTEIMNEVAQANGYSRVNSEIIKFAATTYTVTSIQGNELIVTSNEQTGFDAQYANVFLAGDKIKLTTDQVSGLYSVIKSELVNDGTEQEPNWTTHIFVDSTTLLGTSGNVTHYGFADKLIIFTIEPSEDKITPARLLDTKSHVKLDDVPLWHPAFGIHSTQAIHNVDLQNPEDPAHYSSTLTQVDNLMSPWTFPQVGTTWLQTSTLEYLPYYDDVLTPDIEQRIYQWGKRPEWSSVDVYTWVESLVAPSEWDVTVAAQASDITIPQSEKVTGTPRKTVFKRTRKFDTITIVNPATGLVELNTSNNTYEDGSVFMMSAIDPNITFPDSVDVTLTYTVFNYDIQTNEFVVVDQDGNVVDLTGVPVQIHIVPPFSDNWIRKPLIRERLYAALEYNFVDNPNVREPELVVTDERWETGDVVSVYVNGSVVLTDVILANNTISLTGTQTIIREQDIIDVVRPIPVLTEEQLQFDPDTTDDGVTLEQWTETYEFSTTTRTYNNITYLYYYFWVQNTTTRNPADRSSLSTSEIAAQLAANPTPYMIVQDPRDDLWMQGWDVPPWAKTGWDDDMYIAYNSNHQYMPSIFYRKVVLSQITGYINEGDRYVVEFTRDLTLRDTLETDHNYMNVKNKHEKWFMFRREQIGAVPQDLWVKMTEALMGCKYDDFTKRVPSFEREHYDMTYGTSTRYGFGKDQIFVNPEYARATIVSYLQDPSHNFKPVDINHFFEVFPATEDVFWSDPQQVKEMCDFIYNTFDSYHTNGIWFDVLSDALVTQSKYKGLMKTSWLALHGIRILDVAGQFDD